MSSNFSNASYNQSGYQAVGPIVATLVAGAAAAPIVTFDVTPLHRVTITIDVTVADLTGLEVWVRGDPAAKWMQVTLDQPQIEAYGRSDASTDVTTTAAGATAYLRIETLGSSDVQLRAKSAGAAVLSITAGGK